MHNDYRKCDEGYNRGDKFHYSLRRFYKSALSLSCALKDRKVRDVTDCCGVVYQLTCDCGTKYIGHTARKISTRIKEHQMAASKNKANHSAIADHWMRTGHKLNSDSVSVLDRDGNDHRRRIKETLHILKNHSHIVDQNIGSVPINDIWKLSFDLF